MVKIFLLTSLLMDVCFAYPHFGAETLEYLKGDRRNLADVKDDPGVNAFPANAVAEAANSIYQALPLLQTVSRPRYSDQLSGDMVSPETGSSPLDVNIMYLANMLANNPVHDCLEIMTASLNSVKLMPCLIQAAIEQDKNKHNNKEIYDLHMDERNSNIDGTVNSKRDPLRVNPTGWKRKKRNLTQQDMEERRQGNLEGLKLQQLVSVLLQKRQKPKPRFNPTGW